MTRDEEHEAALFAILGRLKAMEYGLWTLTLSHPDPEDLQRLWARCVPVLVDEHMEMPSHQSEQYRKGLHEAMRNFGVAIENAVARQKGE